MATLLYTVGSSGALTAAANNRHKSNPSSTSSSSHLRASLHIAAGSDRSRSSSSSHVARARRSGLSSRSRRLEKRGKKGGGASTTQEEEAEVAEADETGGVSSGAEIGGGVGLGGGGGEIEYSTEPMPKLEGLEPDFWEGPQWNAFGFFVQYLWAFGILFGLISGGIAVATYNEGATDFKQTPAYKESIQSQELLEGPDASNADVFEANPTETAPSME